MSKEILKGYLPNYLESRGVSLHKIGSCIVCGRGSKTPCAGYNQRTNKYHCFSCGIDYDILDLIAQEEGLDVDKDFKEVLSIGCNMYNIPLESPQNGLNSNYSTNIHSSIKSVSEAKIEQSKDIVDCRQYYNDCHNNLLMTDYMISRGIGQETLDRFLIGYDPKDKCIVIPVSKHFYIKRSVEGKRFMNLKGVEVDIFNKKYLLTKQDSPIYITESAIDSLSLEHLGHKSIGLNSTSNAKKFLQIVESCGVENSFIICCDNDDSGAKCIKELTEGLGKLGLYNVAFNISGSYKDVNEALQNDQGQLVESIPLAVEALTKEINKVADEYMDKMQASRSVGAFFDMVKSKANMPYIPTGFPKLDKLLDGGIYEGLFFVGAISSLGKTTFVLQLADNVAESGQDVLIFSLEMSKYELMAKSISRLTFTESNEPRNAKTVRGITNYKRYARYSDTELKLIVDCINKYEQEYGKNIFILEGVGDIGAAEVRAAVDEHFKKTGNRPMVIIDYVQLLAPIDPRMSDKQNTDKSVLELKRISRDYKIPIIGISSLNRENYNLPISMSAFKESGSIEYSSDVLLGLQAKGIGSDKNFDINKAKSQNPREIELVILKNRNGATGGKVDYNYYTMFNCFKEL